MKLDIRLFLAAIAFHPLGALVLEYAAPPETHPKF